MDPISAVSFAATILTFVDFTAKLVKGSYEIYNSDGASSENAQIGTILEDLDDVTQTLTRDIKSDSPHRAPLRKLATDCTKVSGDLAEVLEDLRRKEGNKAWRSLQAKWKSMRSEKKVESIEKMLVSLRLELVLRLNVIISEEQSSIRSKLDEIDEKGLHHSPETVYELEKVQKVIRSLEKKLMDEMSTIMTKHDSEAVTSSLDEIHSDLATLLTKMEGLSRNSTMENSILKRLYFDTMFARAESIADAGFGTFDWLLNDDTAIPRTSSQTGLRERIEDDESVLRSNFEMGNPNIPSEEMIKVEGEETINNERRTLDEGITDEQHGRLSPDLSSMSGKYSDSAAVGDRSPESQRPPSFIDESEQQLRRETRERFLTWLETGNQVFHISGKAGSGKSTLMKYLSESRQVKERLELWAGDKKLCFASSFFWASGAPEQKSLRGLCRSILFETLRQYPELMKDAFPAYFATENADASRWEGIPFRFRELYEAMKVIVGKRGFPNHRFCFFVDGLDEFQSDWNTDHWDLAQSLRSWALSPDVKICVSSRPYEEFLQGFDPQLRMQLHELTRGDIQRFVEGVLKKDSRFDFDNERELATVIHDVVDRADGVFLWVRLVVRILADGIRHLNSVNTLRQKMERLPKGLEPLFEDLFKRIDPIDRESSDKVLLLMAETGAINALKISWLLDELDDPDFPFNRTMKPLSDDEILSRHERVRAQLDSLSKGLLELREVKEDIPEPDKYSLGEKDIYYSSRVDFFHRTVRDYLNEPERLAAMTKRAGHHFDPVVTMQKLRLAEFKFSRTNEKYFRTQPLMQTSLVSCFDQLWRVDGFNYTAKYLDEVDEILECHRRTPYTDPNESAENQGAMAWSQWLSSKTGYGTLTGKHISYLGWIVSKGLADYTINRIKRDRTLLRHQEGVSLLFVACIAEPPVLTLIKFLLDEGMDPNEEIEVLDCEDRHDIETDTDSSREYRTTTTWLAYLHFWTRTAIKQELGYSRAVGIDKSCEVLECLLEHGAEMDVYMILQHEDANVKDQHRGTVGHEEPRQQLDSSKDIHNDEIQEDGPCDKKVPVCVEAADGEGDGTGRKQGGDPADDTNLVVTLEQLLLYLRPKNLDRLLKLLMERKTSSWWWGGLRAALSPLTGSSRGEKAQLEEVACSRPVKVSQIDSIQGKYIVKAVYANGRRLESNFVVGQF